MNVAWQYIQKRGQIQTKLSQIRVPRIMIGPRTQIVNHVVFLIWSFSKIRL